jgi:DNA (cytosine-5)-methyltransferase 1
LENVQKMRNHERGSTLEAIKDFLGEVGYNVSVWDLCASNYGLPQQRRRLFFCGVLESAAHAQAVLPPAPVMLQHSEYPTTWHLLERAMPAEHMIPYQTRKTVLRKNEKWQGDLEIDRKIARPLTATMAKWHRANQDNYFSASYVNGNFGVSGQKTNVNLECEPIRRITPLEGFRLQGFPDEFEQIRRQQRVSNSASYRLIGNAVPVAMARAVIEQFIGHHVGTETQASGVAREYA